MKVRRVLIAVFGSEYVYTYIKIQEISIVKKTWRPGRIIYNVGELSSCSGSETLNYWFWSTSMIGINIFFPGSE